MKVTDNFQSTAASSDTATRFDNSLSAQNAFIRKTPAPSAPSLQKPNNFSAPQNYSSASSKTFQSSSTRSSSSSSLKSNFSNVFSSKMTTEEASKIAEQDPPIKPAMADLFPKPERAKQKKWLPVTLTKVAVHNVKEYQFNRQLEKYNEARETLGKDKISADIFNPGLPINRDWYRSDEHLPLPPSNVTHQEAAPELTRRNSALSLSSNEDDDLALEMRRLGI